jgi:cell division protein FtsW (lipid II flippase)
MALLRTLLGVVLLVCAAVISFLGIAYNNYKEEAGSTPLHTLDWAIPWTVATVVLGVLVLGSLHPSRRERWSWLALGFAVAMALGLAALVVF